MAEVLTKFLIRPEQSPLKIANVDARKHGRYVLTTLPALVSNFQEKHHFDAASIRLTCWNLRTPFDVTPGKDITNSPRVHFLVRSRAVPEVRSGGIGSPLRPLSVNSIVVELRRMLRRLRRQANTVGMSGEVTIEGDFGKLLFVFYFNACYSRGRFFQYNCPKCKVLVPDSIKEMCL